MYSVNAERSAGWSGLAFLVVLVLSVVVPGGVAPDLSATPAAIGNYFTTHHQGLLISAWLGLPTVAFFLWFAVGVRAHLAHAPGAADGLPLYAISGAIVTASAALLSSAVLSVLLRTSIPVDDLPGWWGFYNLAGYGIAIGSIIFVFATAHSMRRHGSASPPMALLGYVAALGGVLSTFSIFFASGPMSLSGWATLVLGLGLLAIWVIAASFWLIRNAGTATAVS